jgi:hypothetical protein
MRTLDGVSFGDPGESGMLTMRPSQLSGLVSTESGAARAGEMSIKFKIDAF